MEHVELNAAGLLLRPWREEEDAPAVLAALGDPAIGRWNAQQVTDLDRALDWIRWRADWTSGRRLSLAVTDPARGTLPLAPPENRVDVPVRAGELAYHD